MPAFAHIFLHHRAPSAPRAHALLSHQLRVRYVTMTVTPMVVHSAGLLFYVA